jgi:hypothetical protein
VEFNRGDRRQMAPLFADPNGWLIVKLPGARTSLQMIGPADDAS